MKRIPLSKGKFALVDDADYDWLSQHKWTFHPNGYAYRHVYSGKKVQKIYMHREILSPIPDGFIGEHKNGNGLDNQRFNLRIAVQQQNNCNKGASRNSKLGVKGVHKTRSGKYRAQTEHLKRHYNLGTFSALDEAKEAYDRTASKLHGEFFKP